LKEFLGKIGMEIQSVIVLIRKPDIMTVKSIIMWSFGAMQLMRTSLILKTTSSGIFIRIWLKCSQAEYNELSKIGGE
jgi:hypothetical protein